MSRIVHVSECLATGVLSVIATLVKAQLEDGHQVILIGSTSRADTLPAWRAQLPQGVEFHELPMEREVRPRSDLPAALRLRALLRELRPDVVHLHSSKAGALGRVAALGLGTQVVYQPHGVASLRRDVSTLGSLTFGLLEATLAMLGGLVVASCEGEKAALRKLVRTRQLRMVHNAIDLTQVPARMPERTRTTIGTCGRISAQKGPRFFAEVAGALRELADFVWIGDGDEDDKRALVEAGVTVTGWLDRTQALQEIARLSIYVQTSAWEGMPISVIEAMAAGLPVVATDIAGNRDILFGTEAGFLARTPGEMIDKLRNILAQDDLRDRLGRAGRQRAHQHYSSHAMVRRYYELYQLDTDRPATMAAQE